VQGGYVSTVVWGLPAFPFRHFFSHDPAEVTQRQKIRLFGQHIVERFQKALDVPETDRQSRIEP
jgi:hypothetical protein